MVVRGTAITEMLYIKHLIRPGKPSETPAAEDTTIEDSYHMCVKGNTDKFSNILRKYGIKMVFQQHKKLAQFLKSVKDRIKLNAQHLSLIHI